MDRRVFLSSWLSAALFATGAGTAFPSDIPSISAAGHSSPETYPGRTLVWREEFSGNALDPESWVHDTGTGTNGWGNEELQYYRPENARVQDGYLVITARAEALEGSRFTSSRIVTRGKRTVRFGRIDIRALLPEGQGLWPALWLLGETGGWPAGGEIDIMEMVGGQGREDTVHGTLHWGQGREHRYEGGSFTLPSGTFADQFHVFSIEWDATTIFWLVDGHPYLEQDISDPAFDAFRGGFYLLVNLAVGGHWPGDPSGDTSFPRHLVVDYIRVFE
jgi:beta-glucanase (GH16 family)